MGWINLNGSLGIRIEVWEKGEHKINKAEKAERNHQALIYYKQWKYYAQNKPNKITYIHIYFIFT